MKKILITGAAGFIGSHLCEYFSRQGYEVYGLSRNFPLPLLNTNVKIIRGDLACVEDLKRALKNVDIIIHNAALLASKSYNEKLIYQINYEATLNLLEIAKECNIDRFLFISTGGVLGHIENPPADESHSYNPEDAYERSKMLAEIKIIEYSRNGLDAVIVRPTWSYGPRDKRIFKLINAIFKKRFIKIGKCYNLQHPVYISDLMEGIKLALEKGARGSIYFIGGEEILKTAEIIEIIAKLIPANLPPISLPVSLMKLLAYLFDRIYRKRNKEAPFSMTKLGFFTKNRAFSIKKAQEELNYKPKVKFQEGMENTINWYKKEGWLI